jgi:hypothetical protein
LPPNHREELLRILGRMLGERIDQDAAGKEVLNDPR